MNYYTYIILSQNSGKYYIGSTNNLVRRLNQHNDPTRKSWASKYTPWKLVFKKSFGSRSEAMKFEKYLKSLKSRDSLAKYVMGGS